MISRLWHFMSLKNLRPHYNNKKRNEFWFIDTFYINNYNNIYKSSAYRYAFNYKQLFFFFFCITGVCINNKCILLYRIRAKFGPDIF